MEAKGNQRLAIEVLEEALSVLKERHEIYGPAHEHYEDLARLQNAYYFDERTARQVVLQNVLEKLDRIRRTDSEGETFRDSIVDAINYLAIAWECS